MRKLILNSARMIGLIAVLFGFQVVIAADAPATLDGKTFAGMVKHKGEKKADKDNLIFKDGNLHSTACDEFGFKEGHYTSTTKGDTVTFQATTQNEEGAKIEWKGTVKGKKLTASGHWSREGNPPREMTFKGTLK